jgi:hypothetical protein
METTEGDEIMNPDGYPQTMSPLAGDINWMETLNRSASALLNRVMQRPHSLGTLIEWKHNARFLEQLNFHLSPLAGDINWMETAQATYASFTSRGSPLAGDINWMETLIGLFALRIQSPHSLGTLIEWKLGVFLEWPGKYSCCCPHSLGTLIEWKLINSSMLICWKWHG